MPTRATRRPSDPAAIEEAARRPPNLFNPGSNAEVIERIEPVEDEETILGPMLDEESRHCRDQLERAAIVSSGVQLRLEAAEMAYEERPLIKRLLRRRRRYGPASEVVTKVTHDLERDVRLLDKGIGPFHSEMVLDANIADVEEAAGKLDDLVERSYGAQMRDLAGKMAQPEPVAAAPSVGEAPAVGEAGPGEEAPAPAEEAAPEAPAAQEIPEFAKGFNPEAVATLGVDAMVDPAMLSTEGAKKLGSGSFGDVISASATLGEDEAPTEVALKVLSGGAGVGEEEQASLYEAIVSEASAMQAVSEKDATHLVGFLGYTQWGGDRDAIITEFCEHGTVSDMIRAMRDQPIEDRLTVLKYLAQGGLEGLGQIHGTEVGGEKLKHGDFHSDNVLIGGGEGYVPKVSDLGETRAGSDSDRTHDVSKFLKGLRGDLAVREGEDAGAFLELVQLAEEASASEGSEFDVDMALQHGFFDGVDPAGAIGLMKAAQERAARRKAEQEAAAARERAEREARRAAAVEVPPTVAVEEPEQIAREEALADALAPRDAEEEAEVDLDVPAVEASLPPAAQAEEKMAAALGALYDAKAQIPKRSLMDRIKRYDPARLVQEVADAVGGLQGMPEDADTALDRLHRADAAVRALLPKIDAKKGKNLLLALSDIAESLKLEGAGGESV